MTSSNNQAQTSLARILPYNIEAEQMLLGAILINPQLINQTEEFLKSEHFFGQLHQKIYSAIQILIEKGLTPTPIVLKSALDRDPLFQESGGINYLNNLTTMAMLVINPKEYGRLIYELALKRSLIAIGEDVVNTAYDSQIQSSATELIEKAEGKLYNLASEGTEDRGFVKFSTSIAESLEKIDRAMKNPNHITGISTKLKDLDDILLGLHDSDLIIIAARPSMGKTAFAMNLAVNSAEILKEKQGNNPQAGGVGFFSLEMSSEQIATRMLSMYTSIDSTTLRSGKIGQEKYNIIKAAASKLADLPLFIDDSAALSIAAVRARARRLKRKHNLSVLFIDYLQLLKGTNNTENRVLEVSEITQGLKALAKELNIPVIALSQLSRAVEKREDNKPMLSDLRESGSIEQDADIVMFLYREEYYLTRSQPNPGTDEHSKWQEKLDKVRNLSDIIVAKHRNGAVGNVRLHYDTQYSRFSNYAEQYISQK